jgi:hypothetical protein
VWALGHSSSLLAWDSIGARKFEALAATQHILTGSMCGQVLAERKANDSRIGIRVEKFRICLAGQGFLSTSHNYMNSAVNYQFVVIMSLIVNFNYPKPKH